jgi:CrcB protein
MPTITSTLDRHALAAIALGGGLGSLARYGISRACPPATGAIPWSTLAINLTGSLLLGMLVVAVTEIWRPHRLVRPFLGTGVLGGYTTFSTFAVEVRGLPAGHAWLYLTLSVVGGLAAALVGMALIRQLEPRFSIASTHELVDPLDPEQP